MSARLQAESEEHVVERLEEAVAARMIEEVPQAPRRYQFTHALIQETLYDELTTARRVRLHRRIGDILEGLYAANLESHVAQLAYHFEEAAQSGSADKAIAYAMQAGARSMAALDYAEAMRFYRMALDALELQDSTDAAQRCRLLLAFGEAQRRAGEFPQALETLQHGATIAGRLGWSEDFARAAATFEVVTWLSGLPTAPAVRLLEEALRQPFYLYIGTRMCAMWALLEGRFAESEQLALQALTLGRRMHVENVEGAFGLQMFTLRRQQGRLNELEPVFLGSVRQHMAAATCRAGLALIYSELGRAPEAQAEFEHLAQNDFADLPRDALWSTSLPYLAQVCAFLGDAERAATLYQLLLPYAGYAVIAGEAVVCDGAADGYLGLLAATMGQWEASSRHFEQALAVNARMGAKPCLARTRYEYAAKLLARVEAGDRDKVVALLNEALALACMLGLHSLSESRIASYIGMAKGELPSRHYFGTWRSFPKTCDWS